MTPIKKLAVQGLIIYGYVQAASMMFKGARGIFRFTRRQLNP